MGCPVSSFIAEGKGGLQPRVAKGGKRKRRKKRKRKTKGVVFDVVYFLSRIPLVVRGMETCVIPGSCSSLEQHAFPVNLDEAPHPAQG
jgi:hypothetical protein